MIPRDNVKNSHDLRVSHARGYVREKNYRKYEFKQEIPVANKKKNAKWSLRTKKTSKRLVPLKPAEVVTPADKICSHRG